MSAERDVTEREDPAVLFTATVRTPIAPMHGEPRIASQMISQQVAGHRIEAVDAAGDWVRARGDDGYEGWMHVGFLARSPQGAMRQSRQSTRISLGCITGTAAGGRRSLPLRAFLAPDEVVHSGDSVDGGKMAERFPLDATAIAQSACEFFAATSYLWGGVTPWGADCSGLVQSVFALHGVPLPRDAWQQARAGRDAGRELLATRPADLLFFSDRPDAHITHVAIALGEHRLVHLALGRGGYAVERLDDERNEYVRKLGERFLFAREML